MTTDDFDRIADRLLSQEKRDQIALYKLEGDLHGLHLTFDKISRPLTDEEVRLPLITLQSLERKLLAGRTPKLELLK